MELAWLDPRTGIEQRVTVTLPVGIGRQADFMTGVDQTIVLEDPDVSYFHALIEMRQGQTWVVDQGSSRGTKVNGNPVVEQTIGVGDRLKVGSVVIRVLSAATAPEPEPEPGLTDGSWRCFRKVGFLIKRDCERTSPEGCPDCQGGTLVEDPYFHDYDLYPGYGTYGHGSWGYSYYRDRDQYYYNTETRNVDFTDADAASFEQELESDYEMDMGAS